MKKRRLQLLQPRQKEDQKDCMVISPVPEKGKMLGHMSYLLEKEKSSNRKANASTANKLVIWHHNDHRRNL